MDKYMIIDGMRIPFTDEKNILQVIHKAGIHVPTFCYYSDMSIFGACRMCVVEDNRGGILASCSTPPKDKLEIKTNTPRLHEYRKMILELLLAAHCRDCTVCEKNGRCRLQMLAVRFGLTEIRFKNNREEMEIDDSSESIIRDPGKCILCGDCVRMCNEVQNVGAIDFAYRGSNMRVLPAMGKKIAETNCVNCGQCAAVCPTAAIHVKSSLRAAWKALYDPKARVVAQVAPAVRVALGEEFGLEPGKNTMGRIYAALRMLGFDSVFDTSVGADLTVVEESDELIKKLEAGDDKYPLFTSCCPAWVRYVETKHPELLPYVSSCKSPMGMFGAVLKEHYKQKDEEEGMRTVSVAIMPCAAKKFEITREELSRNGIRDVDIVITTSELARMIKEIGIQFNEIDPQGPDMPFSISSGAGTIFGATGGVTEAALRRVAGAKTNEDLKAIEYLGVRGLEGVKTAKVPYGDKELDIAIVSGLGNAEKLIKAIESGELHFDFVEVMACPLGCVAGAGQPFVYREGKEKRAAGLYKADRSSVIKCSQDSPVIEDLYAGVLNGRVHELLHREK
ncbi:MAG: (2Fe-2S)-binding protein [Lachnospiraceae bacterium]|jgi:NADH-quinone oxidoreductase subunit G|nr:(2Fe-2S)-binding protein [Lachnospiraceae bacterium]